MINPIIHRKQIELLVLKFFVAIVLKIIIEQTLYEAVGKRLFLNLIIRRLCYRFALQKILYQMMVIKVPSWFIELILLFILKTSRITIIGKEELKRIEKGKERVIFAFWHGNYTLLLISLRMKNAVALVHSSFRGNYIAQLASVFHYRIVRTPRGGRSVVQLVKVIKQGYSGLIAVDGPQGPPNETKTGTIYIARKLGAKIIPLTVEAKRGFLLRGRWDNHFLPLPFNNITVYIGKPIVVKADDSLEAKGEEVTRSLFELTEMARKGPSSLCSCN